ncbi:MAG: 16S rRNA (cytidine(1402)-2'-O)-methyltransferase [Candidatus Magasanikbacteria bacterium]|jgi:16S rRNA (cytidine1402-2'-O)-methyltransferase|nr:16S rRNA (cytidine(1402)-2'-O)-methyltransferase [Candidatus Magasanikbacteria bacterium]MBT4221386.1 16S rRNA (cytidine(1402)-2'-O)-methyltransferase [Candidatus Magasanikbacteria bacterium]MBT4350766.1 16S rRNA (cytidine(1402)-2'-O)-methyltransferase [Candidatus Magasanikbacteria bacterium]MBT4541558.1 16S rRNA (cytidine(1402)-2'-O)-methyltransferase [Candidatus Magasanikbacteria bacterium]MBT6253510.1 16S rRNA (cytidine(1402)-2'-O)-methyltransferase [Candidatus Magasanikbacteria bacterium
MTNPTLYIVATPIGNLGDFSERAIDTLQAVEVIFCEDTRVTSRLLSRYNIDTHARSYHQHSAQKKTDEIMDMLRQGDDVALVTDAGTPGISDPGGELVFAVRHELPDVSIVPIPGASAVVTALSISGFRLDSFSFLGFPPHKKRRQQFFDRVCATTHTVVFYESCHRIEKALKQLAEGLDEKKQVCVCRELTKKFETIYRGTMSEILEMNIPAKGEFVIVVS